MKIAALILGLIGGIAGVITSVSLITIAFAPPEDADMIALGFAALAFSLLGIIGGAVALAKPRGAGYWMLIAGIGGFLSISAAYAIAGPLLLVGGVLSLVASRGEKKRAPVPEGLPHEKTLFPVR